MKINNYTVYTFFAAGKIPVDGTTCSLRKSCKAAIEKAYGDTYENIKSQGGRIVKMKLTAINQSN